MTHRVDEVEFLCDDVAVMVNGRIVIWGESKHVMAGYDKVYTFTVKQTYKQY